MSQMSMLRNVGWTLKDFAVEKGRACRAECEAGAKKGACEFDSRCTGGLDQS